MVGVGVLITGALSYVVGFTNGVEILTAQLSFLVLLGLCEGAATLFSIPRKQSAADNGA
jgi:hypothetical protein